MILFHTSSIIIKEPDIHIGRSNTDFGQGFYLTPDESFAGSWARERTSSDVYVNRYELKTEGLRVMIFDKDAEWFEYILDNRRSKPDRLHDYDVIIGPVANDTLFETFGLLTSGFLTMEQSLQILSSGPEYTQVAIRSDAGAKALKWLDAEILSAGSMAAARKEYERAKAAFDEGFAKALAE
ncbi:MAG: DUF3990 domain-containing protein [Mogibacterium sp.]|nr:DUF3990 domain-containing protein [Mogibacterium sp.]MBQ6500496.1 DUF3990 domain-containing protein [Mogibacterium sp.]